MQTFLPFPDYGQTALVLDRARLGKQRVETAQLMDALLNGPDGNNGRWAAHPAAGMWRGYEGALFLYHTAICAAWKARGYKDEQHQKVREMMWDRDIDMSIAPPWLGDEDFHLSHRSNLMRKMLVTPEDTLRRMRLTRDHYEPFFEPDLPIDLAYWWPETYVRLDNGQEGYWLNPGTPITEDDLP